MRVPTEEFYNIIIDILVANDWIITKSSSIDAKADPNDTSVLENYDMVTLKARREFSRGKWFWEKFDQVYFELTIHRHTDSDFFLLTQFYTGLGKDNPLDLQLLNPDTFLIRYGIRTIGIPTSIENPIDLWTNEGLVFKCPIELFHLLQEYDEIASATGHKVLFRT